MTREEVFENVQEIFRDIFDDQELVIVDSTNSDEIGEWDSLNHIDVIVAIQNEFKIKFDFNESAGIKDVGTMVDLIIKKINN